MWWGLCQQECITRSQTYGAYLVVGSESQKPLTKPTPFLYEVSCLRYFIVMTKTGSIALTPSHHPPRCFQSSLPTGGGPWCLFAQVLPWLVLSPSSLLEIKATPSSLSWVPSSNRTSYFSPFIIQQDRIAKPCYNLIAQRYFLFHLPFLQNLAQLTLVIIISYTCSLVD